MNTTYPHQQRPAIRATRPRQCQSERTVRDLQEDRDRLLVAGRLEPAAELTAWIDELMAEGPRS